MLLPGASQEVAESVVKRIRHNVYKTTLDLRSRMIRCSVSIGVVTFPKDGRDMRELMSTADHRMYRDKELRRAPGAQANVLSRARCPAHAETVWSFRGLMAKLALHHAEA